MADEQKQDGGKTVAFFLGVLVGMLLCLGGGSVYVLTIHKRQEFAAREAMMMALDARERANQARAEAEKRLQAEKLLYATQLRQAQQGLDENQSGDAPPEKLKMPKAD